MDYNKFKIFTTFFFIINLPFHIFGDETARFN